MAGAERSTALARLSSEVGWRRGYVALSRTVVWLRVFGDGELWSWAAQRGWRRALASLSPTGVAPAVRYWSPAEVWTWYAWLATRRSRTVGRLGVRAQGRQFLANGLRRHERGWALAAVGWRAVVVGTAAWGVGSALRPARRASRTVAGDAVYQPTLAARSRWRWWGWWAWLAVGAVPVVLGGRLWARTVRSAGTGAWPGGAVDAVRRLRRAEGAVVAVLGLLVGLLPALSRDRRVLAAVAVGGTVALTEAVAFAVLLAARASA